MFFCVLIGFAVFVGFGFVFSSVLFVCVFFLQGKKQKQFSLRCHSGISGCSCVGVCRPAVDRLCFYCKGEKSFVAPPSPSQSFESC